jgi:hypothetical protein
VFVTGAQNYYCTAGFVMMPTNPKATGERWHYDLFVSVGAPKQKGGGGRGVVYRSPPVSVPGDLDVPVA